MNDDTLLLEVARHIRRAKAFLAQGAHTDARRHTERAESLLTVLAHARLVRAATKFVAAKSS